MSHSHRHSHQHHGLVHSHDHHHGPAGAWTPETAEWYAERFGEWPSQGLLAAKVELPAGGTVVDVGCGTGGLLREVCARHPGAVAVGIDAMPTMIARARASAGDAGARFEVADAASLPLADGTADVVLFLNTLHHLGDPGAAMAEAARVLRPGGVVWVGTDEDVYDMSGWSNGRVRDELSGAGLRRVRQTSAHTGDVVLNLLSALRRA